MQMLITSATNSLLIIPDVVHTLLEEGNNVGISNAVIDFLTITARRHYTRLSQSAHVMGNGRLADSNQLGQPAHVFLPIQQSGHDPHPARIAESTKELSDVGAHVFIQN